MIREEYYYGNLGKKLQKPEIIFGLKYTGIDKLTLETEISDKMEVRHEIYSKKQIK